MSWAMNRYRLSRAVHGIGVNYRRRMGLLTVGIDGGYVKAQGTEQGWSEVIVAAKAS